MKAKRMQAVVLGRNFASLLGMIRAVGQTGCEVTVVRTVRKIPSKYSIKTIVQGPPIESKSKYVKKHMYAIEPDGHGLINILLKEFANTEEKVLLFPTDDFTASAIDLYQDLLVEKFLYPNIDYVAGAVVALMDKSTQKQLATAAGLRVANSWTTEVHGGRYLIPEGIVYPVFTKPQISFLGDKTLMQRCNNQDELEAFLSKTVKEGDCPILIEQYIEIEREFAVLGYINKNMVVMPCIIELIQSGSGTHRGVTLMGKVSPLSDKEPISFILSQFMVSSNFLGLFDIDLYFSNGEYYFNELNLRFGASGYAVTASGMNLPEMLVETFCGDKMNSSLINNSSKIQNVSFVNEKVNLEEYASGYIDWKTYKSNLTSAELQFIKSKDDPKPNLAFRRMELIYRVIQVLKSGLTNKIK